MDDDDLDFDLGYPRQPCVFCGSPRAEFAKNGDRSLHDVSCANCPGWYRIGGTAVAQVAFRDQQYRDEQREVVASAGDFAHMVDFWQEGRTFPMLHHGGSMWAAHCERHDDGHYVLFRKFGDLTASQSALLHDRSWEAIERNISELVALIQQSRPVPRADIRP